MNWKKISAVLAVLVLAGPAWADYDAGKRAMEAGRVAEALRQWRAAAASEDRRAMLELGRLFVRGLGVPQNYVRAHMWLNLAAARGEVAAADERDALVAKMTAPERAEAQKLALDWRPGEAAKDVQRAEAATREAPAGPPPPRAIREAQGLLAALGYKSGPADGKWGRRTAAAHAAFLRDAGLEASDTLSPAALRALRRIAGDRKAKPAKQAPPKPLASLHLLVKAGDVDGLKAALAGGGARKIDERDGRGWTALMHAADKGYALLIPHLLEAGAKVDLRAPDGATALFIAIVHGHMEVMGLLMKAGANVLIAGPKGKTAVDLARITYGTPDDLGGKNLDPAIAALVRGESWAQVMAAKELRRKFPPGKTFRDCPECPEMVVVPAGSFTMGSPAPEDEGPQHRVTISQPFAVGKYEVTFSEWDACVSAGGCNGYRPGDEGWGRGSRPVIEVSWEDAKSYVAWLSRRTGQRYRLLTEAEWEYAARAKTRTGYSWGDRIGRNRANCYGCGSRRDSQGTAPAGSFPANGFGLHDMHGNVWEWVEDCWHKSYAGAPSDGSAWVAGGDCSVRVLRGGSWDDAPGFLRSAGRGGNVAGFRYFSYGFRVARTLTP